MADEATPTYSFPANSHCCEMPSKWRTKQRICMTLPPIPVVVRCRRNGGRSNQWWLRSHTALRCEMPSKWRTKQLYFPKSLREDVVRCRRNGGRSNCLFVCLCCHSCCEMPSKWRTKQLYTAWTRAASLVVRCRRNGGRSNPGDGEVEALERCEMPSKWRPKQLLSPSSPGVGSL